MGAVLKTGCHKSKPVVLHPMPTTPNDVYEALLTGAFTVQAILFAILGLFYTIYETLAVPALSAQPPKQKPIACTQLTRLSKWTFWFSALTFVTAVWSLTALKISEQAIVIATPLVLATVGMLVIARHVAYKLMP
jgi:hypothetical protein